MYAGLFLRLCVHQLWPAYVRSHLCTWALTRVREMPGRGPTLSIFTFFFFFNCFTSICNLNTFFFLCHFCIWISPNPSFYLYSCIESSISQHFAWIKESNITFFFHSPYLLMLVKEALIRWWSGTTFSFLKPGPIFGRRALSLSLDFFRRSLPVLPWCSASLRDGGILPTPFILLSES